jgi:DNA-binding phage protein
VLLQAASASAAMPAIAREAGEERNSMRRSIRRCGQPELRLCTR